MGRTTISATTKLSPKWGTSSGVNPEEDFKEPEDATDLVGLDTEIPRGSARSTGSLLEPKPKPRSPIGVEIGKSAGGGLNVTVAVPLGGGPISGRGGISIGKGGAITGGNIGLGFGLGPIGGAIDIGTDQDEEGRGGCYQFVTLTVGPFAHTYGRNVCEPKPKAKEDDDNEDFTLACQWVANFRTQVKIIRKNQEPLFVTSDSLRIPVTYRKEMIDTPFGPQEFWVSYTGIWFEKIKGMSVKINRAPIAYAENTDYQVINSTIISWVRIGKWDFPKTSDSYAYINPLERTTQDPVPSCKYEDPDTGLDPDKELYPEVITDPPAAVTPDPNPPLPNPPPKKMDDKCCDVSIALLLEILRLLGREIGPNGLPPQTDKKGFLGEEFERIQTPIVNPSKPEKVKIKFLTIYDLLVYAYNQSTNLDVALDPQSYKPPTGFVQNPKYSRDSEQSLKNNSQPDKDRNGNKRELEINKDEEMKMGGFLAQQQYVFDALRRLEYLFPLGELNDAVIAKNLLIPGAKDDLKIHNMIMAYEVQLQYLNSVFGNPRELITVKDANPGLEGDQSIEVRCLSISAMLREIIKFQIDTGGDVDAQTNLAVRTFRTVMANRIDIVKTGEAVQALFEDTGMLESQHYIDLHLEGDPYAGQWEKGQGFKPNPDLEKKTEEATEKVLLATMIPGNVRIKVSRRSKDEKTDIRDLFRGLADFMQRLLSIPSAGDAAKSIDKLIESAKFKVQTEMALIRQNVVKAASASRNRTRKKKK